MNHLMKYHVNYVKHFSEKLMKKFKDQECGYKQIPNMSLEASRSLPLLFLLLLRSESITYYRHLKDCHGDDDDDVASRTIDSC